MTQNSSNLQLKDLSHYGADTRLVDSLRANNFKEFRGIQTESIEKGIFNNTSFFICSPSGSGKTLIGEMAAINSILKNKRSKSLYLVPLRALAGEKHAYFENNYGYMGINIEMAVGDMDIKFSQINNANLLIMTYEKFDAFLREYRENSWINDITTVIVDEIHILGEEKRGPRLESLLLRTFSFIKNIQAICLSATVANPEELGDWLKLLNNKYSENPLEIITSDKRPIELEYGIVTSTNKINTIMKISKPILENDGQILIFTNSRRDSEIVAEELSDFILPFLTDENKKNITQALKSKEISFQNNDSGFKENLIDLIKRGIAFHHAGLESNERYIIERLFIERYIKLIVCTTTLSAGINTPARLVILKENLVYDMDISEVEEPNSNKQKSRIYKKRRMDRNTFHQILGRAGRPEFDDIGIARIISDNNQDALEIQDYYFAKQTQSKKGFVPKYDEILSHLSTKRTFLEFILVSIYEQNGITITDLYKLIDYSYFKLNLNKRGKYKDVLFSLLDAEIIQLLKIYSIPEDIISLQKKPFEFRITEFTTSKINGLAIHKESNKSFNIKMNSDNHLSCDCRKKYYKYQKKNNDSNIDLVPRFKFCIHQTGFLQYINENISNIEFKLVKDNSKLINMEDKKLNDLKIENSIKNAADLFDEIQKDNKFVDGSTIDIKFDQNEENYKEGYVSKIFVKNIVEKIINKAIRSENIIEYLLSNKLIKAIKPILFDNKETVEIKSKNKDYDDLTILDDFDENYEIETNTTFQCTNIGKSVVKNYILPQSALKFLKMLVKKPLNQNFLENQNSKERDLDIFKIIDHFFQLEGRKRIKQFYPVLEYRASGMSIDELYLQIIKDANENNNSDRIYIIDIKNFIEYASRVLNFMADFTESIILDKNLHESINRDEFQFYNYYNQSFESMLYRIRLGIDESKVFLAIHFRELTVEQINKLYTNGINSTLSLTNLEPETLSGLLNISLEKAKKMMNLLNH